jgi:molecular chaperone HtpG
MRDKDRDKYETFFKSFGRILKYGIYSNFGMDKDFLEDLLLFYSSTFKKLITIEEYIKDMKENQKYIYYATGESIDKIDKLPQTEFAKDKGYDILYLTEEVDEFTIKTLFKYKDKEFKSVSSESDEFANENNDTEENKELFTFMKETLGDKVNDVKASEKLKNYPVCITSKGDLSIEMEKVLKTMPNSDRVKAIKILEINPNHEIFKVLKESFEYNKGKLKALTNVLYNQALLIEGLAIDDPVEYANDVYNLIK